MTHTGLRIKGMIFDLYGTLVDVGAIAEACREVAPDPIAFNNQWRAKQLEYTFLRTLMGQYRDFWTVTGEALAFAVARFTLEMTAEQQQRLMAAWLLPTPYPEVAAALPRLKATYLLAILSNGTQELLRSGLERTALWPHFTSVLSADSVQRYKPSPEVYQLHSTTRDSVKTRSWLFRQTRGMCWEPKASASTSAGSIEPVDCWTRWAFVRISW